MPFEDLSNLPTASSSSEAKPVNSSKRIYQLPPELANQIAAGEVIERPASILKELLENSLDAGSSQIDIQIEKGGLGLIRVQDNGSGICQEDLELALSQHATSKILCFADLENVASFGFRGEALASIAAVSRLSLTSCVAGQTSGFCIQREGRNSHTHLLRSPPVVGTTVEVRDVFYNTPARRKFLRSEKTESLYIEECFKRIALSQPTVSFTFKIDNKPAKRFVACKTREAEGRRVAELCSANFVKTAHFIEADNNGLKIRGWLGAPEETRAQADLQFFYVNGRSIRDKLVNFALRQAYQEYSPAGRYPAYVLFFELDPEAVDVNVHPTKHEVRFREARSVSAFLIYSVRQALSTATAKEPPPSLQAERNTIITSTTIENSVASRVETDLLATATSESTQVKTEPLIEKILTILGNELLIGENAKGLILVNMKTVIHAWTRNRLAQALLPTKNNVTPMIPSRPLLMPLRILLKNNSLKHYFEHPVLNFEQLGFVCSQIGPDTIWVRQVPFVIQTLSEDFESFFEKLLSSLQIEQAIEYISEYVAQHETKAFNIENIESILQTFQIMPDNQANIFYRQFTQEELKTML